MDKEILDGIATHPEGRKIGEDIIVDYRNDIERIQERHNKSVALLRDAFPDNEERVAEIAGQHAEERDQSIAEIEALIAAVEEAIKRRGD